MFNLFKLSFIVITGVITGLTLAHYFKNDGKSFFIFFFLFLLTYIAGCFGGTVFIKANLDFIMKKLQFGKTEAAICLSETLSRLEYKKYSKHVSSILHEYNHIINEIDFSNLNIKTKKMLFKLVRNELKCQLFEKQIINLPSILKNFVFNIFTANYRKAIKNEQTRNNLSERYYRLKKTQ